jgi:hypothetical protein
MAIRSKAISWRIAALEVDDKRKSTPHGIRVLHILVNDMHPASDSAFL